MTFNKSRVPNDIAPIPVWIILSLQFWYLILSYRLYLVNVQARMYSSAMTLIVSQNSILSSALDRQQFKVNVLLFCQKTCIFSHQQYTVHYKFCTKLYFIIRMVMRCSSIAAPLGYNILAATGHFPLNVSASNSTSIM